VIIPFKDRKLLDDIITQIFKQKAMGGLSQEEADCLLDLKKLMETDEAAKLFDVLRQAFLSPGECAQDEERRGLILATLRSADLRNPDDIKMVIEVVSQLTGTEETGAF
jgi:hypothetical protein